MLYDKGNVVHQQIMEAASQIVLLDAVNVCTMLVESDIKLLVRNALAKAVTSHCHDQSEW